MRAEAKCLRARASEHSSNFFEQFEQRPSFASTSKLNGTIRYPSRSQSPLSSYEVVPCVVSLCFCIVSVFVVIFQLCYLFMCYKTHCFN